MYRTKSEQIAECPSTALVLLSAYQPAPSSSPTHSQHESTSTETSWPSGLDVI